MAAVPQLISLLLSLSSFKMVLLCMPRRLPLWAYDQVVALTSARQGEIKHATVRRHTRRSKLQLLTCDIKEAASIKTRRQRRRGESEREGRKMGAGSDVRGN